MSADSDIDGEKLYEFAATYAQVDPTHIKILMAYIQQELKQFAVKRGLPLDTDSDILHQAWTATMLELVEKFAPDNGPGHSETRARLRRMNLLQNNS